MDIVKLVRSGHQKLRIAYLAVEAYPFAKIGGLADVASALPKSLIERGHDVDLILPKYSSIDETEFDLAGPILRIPVSFDGRIIDAEIYESNHLGEVNTLFVGNDEYFGRANVYGYNDDDERFLFFCKSIQALLETTLWKPDIIHCNDWHTSILPSYLRASRKAPLFSDIATILTIHNLSYQGPFGERTLELIGNGSQDLGTNLMARGIISSDAVNTVSHTYAEEIKTPAYGEKLEHLLVEKGDRLSGILNGVDYEIYEPSDDPFIARKFSVNTVSDRVENKRSLLAKCGMDADDEAPLLGVICRLVWQKGIDVFLESVADLIAMGARVVVMGLGEQGYIDALHRHSATYPGRFAYLETADERLARTFYAGCDFLLFPSNFEPCGLGPLIGMRYGAVPIVRRTGGLAETIKDYGDDCARANGFSFDEGETGAVVAAVKRALAVYRNQGRMNALRRRTMKADFSWTGPAEEYEALYYDALTVRRANLGANLRVEA